MRLRWAIILGSVVAFLAACAPASSTTTTSTNAAPQAVITASVTSGTAPLEVQFSALSSTDSDGSISLYLWDFGDSTGYDATATPSHTFAYGASFVVTLIVVDDGLLSSTTTMVINVDPPVAPVAHANATPTSGRAPLVVQFDGGSSTAPAGSIVSYAWDFGDGSTSTLASPSHTYTSVGNYLATLTVTDNLGASNTDSVTISANANQPPVAQATASTQLGITPLSVAFDATGSSDPDGTVAGYAWDFGDGSSGTGATPTHVYTSTGIFTAKVTVTDNAGATDSANVIVTAVGNAAPTPLITASALSGPAPLTVDFGSGLSFDLDGTIVSRSWTFGDGGTSTATSPSHTYTTVGTFTATLTVQDDRGATNSTSVEVSTSAPANKPPVPKIDCSPLTGLRPLKVTCSASGSTDPDGTITSYAWDFGDNTTGSGVSASHLYQSAGFNLVTLTVTDNSNDSASTTVLVTVLPNISPVAAIQANPTTGQEGLSVTFGVFGSLDLDGTIDSYTWNFGDGGTGTGTGPTHVYNTAGTYTATVTATDNGGATSSASATITVTPNTAPTAILNAAPTTGSVPLSVSFDGSASADPGGSIASYAWDFGDGTSATGSVIGHTYSTVGTYTAKLTVTDNRGAQTVATTTIKVDPVTFNGVVTGDAPSRYWRFQESSGAVINSGSVSGDASVVGGVTRPVAGINGTTDPDNAYSFNGSTGYVTDGSTLALGSTYSVELWYKSSDSNGGGLLSYQSTGDCSTGVGGATVYLNTSGKLAFSVDNVISRATITATTASNNNAWHHVVATYSGTGTNGVKLYQDGALVGQATGSSSTLSAQKWIVGCTNNGLAVPNLNLGANWLAASIDEVAVYSGKVLSAADVTRHYNAGL